MNQELLNTLFKAPKNEDTGWYVTDKLGERIWDTKKVNLFWKEFEKNKIEKQDYNFEGFVFPVFRKKRNVYYFSSKVEFEKNVSFNNVTFVDVARFSNVSQFLEDVTITNVHFQDELDFHRVRFFGATRIGNCVIDGNVDIVSTQFKYGTFYNLTCKGNIDFRNANVTNAISFSNINITGTFQLDKTNINSEIRIDKSFFNGVVSCKEVTIPGDFYINDCNFSSPFNMVESGVSKIHLSSVIFDAQFKILKCSIGLAIIEDVIFDSIVLSQINFNEPVLHPTVIGFLNIDFPAKSKFERINLEEVTFNFCELSTINFRNCI